jgi:hypothetical protein
MSHRTPDVERGRLIRGGSVVRHVEQARVSHWSVSAELNHVGPRQTWRATSQRAFTQPDRGIMICSDAGALEGLGLPDHRTSCRRVLA